MNQLRRFLKILAEFMGIIRSFVDRPRLSDSIIGDKKIKRKTCRKVASWVLHDEGCISLRKQI
jgi:hypothetical protein